MSKEMDRHTVFQTTRVRSSLKNDVCWIHKPKQEQEESRTEDAVKPRPAFVKQNSYVLSTAKKFDDSSNQANSEVIPPQEDAQPEGSTVETTDDAKPQAFTEELTQKDEAKPENTVANTTAETKKEYTAVYQSNVEQNGGAADVSAEVKDQDAKQQLVSPMEPAEPTVAHATAENNGEITGKTVDQSNIECNEAKLSVDTHVEDPAAETSAVPAVELKPKEEPATKTESENATQLEHAGLQSIVHPAEGSCEKGPPEQAAEEIVEAVAEVAVESSPETPAVTGAAGENAALQVSVEPYPHIAADTASESPSQAAAETAVKPKESMVESAASGEPVLKTAAEVVVQCEVQPVNNLVIEQCVEPERAAAHVVELTIKDAVEPVTPSDAEAAQDEFSDRLIKLSEALDVEPPTIEAAPEPLKDPKQYHTEESKLNQHSDDNNISDMSQRSKEDPQSTQTQDEARNSNVCSFCEKIIEGRVKIYLSEPVVTCHPDCLKCGVCAKALGDMLTTMFLHDQVVQCGGCFAEGLKNRT
ncbi:enolase-phosphatase E1 [Clinocottus analis]|uniref:enolase-phosphatase E1 n=1 Tax=Clinocottus analis TaxID=304258 RepID=UPI0035C0FDC0